MCFLPLSNWLSINIEVVTDIDISPSERIIDIANYVCNFPDILFLEINVAKFLFAI